MTLNLTVPQQVHTDFSPRITVIGVGGGGTNAVDNMIALNLQGVEFVVANTDAQQLMHSRADRRIQLGPHITQGLGAGAKPEIGRAAAEEAADELYRHLDGTHMLFITAGMGGGTGTGAAPVIARMARERNILTVGVVTKPFAFEGSRRARVAEQGIEELQQYVDTLIVIPNQNLFRLANERTGWKEAFKMADQVLYMGVRGVTDLMVMPGLVNLDFADIRTVMAEMGKAMMGTGEAEGENRAIRAAEAAISNPLLEDTSMAGAKGLLINITGGEDLTLFEVDQAANRIREEVDEDANIIFGSAIDEELQGRIRVSVVATGIDSPVRAEATRPRLVAVGGMAGVAEASPAAPMAVAAQGMAETAMAPAEAFAAAEPATPEPNFVSSTEHTTIAGQGVAQPIELRPASRLAASAQPTAPRASAHTAPSVGIGTRSAASATAPDPTQSVPPRGMFAASGRNASAAAAANPASPARVHPARPSLFGIVTGAIRRNLPGGQPNAAEAVSAPRVEKTAPELAPEPERERASVRLAASEDIGLDIPAFLRRQSS
jgi:cell division protein FtsZ